MKSVLLIWTTLLIAFIFYLLLDDLFQLCLKGPNRFVFEGDKDNAYQNLLVVRDVRGTVEADALVDGFLDSANMDLLTKEVAIRYVQEHKRYEYYHKLLDVKRHFEAIGPDSTWKVEIWPGRFRGGHLRSNTVVVYELRETIEEFEAILHP